MPARPVPLALVIPAVVLACLAVVLVLVGVLGLLRRLPPNRWLGVRTAAATRSRVAFRLANRAAGGPLVAAGAVAGLAALGMVLVATTAAAVTVGVLGVAATALLTPAAGAVGDRAARAAAPSSCGGGCAGCVLACAPGGGPDPAGSPARGAADDQLRSRSIG